MYKGGLWRSRYGYWLKRCSYGSSVTRLKIQRTKMKQDTKVLSESYHPWEGHLDVLLNVLWYFDRLANDRAGDLEEFAAFLSPCYPYGIIFFYFKLIEITLASHARWISQYLTMIRNRLASWTKAKMNTSCWHVQRRERTSSALWWLVHLRVPNIKWLYSALWRHLDSFLDM